MMSHTLNPPVTRGSRAGFVVDEADVDTIEMELRPEDLARLAQISAPEAAPSAPAEGAQPAAVRVQSIQAELAATLAPRPADAAAPGPPPMAASPGPDEPAAPAKNAPVLVTDPAQFSKHPAPPHLPTSPVSTARIVPILPARDSPVSRTRGPVLSVAWVAPAPKVQVMAVPAPHGMSEKPRTAATSPEAPRGARWLGVTLIGLFAIGAASVWLSSVASLQAEDPAPPPVPIATVEPEPAPTPVAPPPEKLPAIPPAAVLKFRNPFDAAEVFEFPTGTSQTEARQAVAQFLLQRACERQSQLATANAAQSPCGQASTPADLLRTSTTDGT